jgi:hypothetical protein
MLDGTPAGFGSIDCRGRFRALRESSGAFSAHRTALSTDILWYLLGRLVLVPVKGPLPIA